MQNILNYIKDKNYTQAIKISQNLNDVFYAKEKDLERIDVNRLRDFDNLSSYYIAKLNSNTIKNELDRKFKAEEEKIITATENFWDLVSNNLRTGYGQGYPVTVQNSDALLIRNQELIKINYIHNKNNIDIPFSLSLKSNNMYYKSPSDGVTWNDYDIQQYTIYQTKI